MGNLVNSPQWLQQPRPWPQPLRLSIASVRGIPHYGVSKMIQRKGKIKSITLLTWSIMLMIPLELAAPEAALVGQGVPTAQLNLELLHTGWTRIAMKLFRLWSSQEYLLQPRIWMPFVKAVGIQPLMRL